MSYYFAENKTTEMASITCFKCNKNIHEMMGCFKCDSCEKYFHPSYKNILGKHIQRLAAHRTWYCNPVCEKNNQPITVQQPPNISDENTTSSNEIGNKLDKLFSIYQTQANNFSNMCLTMENLERTIGEIKCSQEFLSKQFDTALHDIKQLKEENNKLNKIVKDLTNEQQLQQTGIANLESQMDKIDQEKIIGNIIITGLTDQVANPKDILQQICNKLNVAVDQENDVISVNFMHDLQAASKTKITTKPQVSSNFIVVKFASEIIKQKLMDGMKVKGTLFSNEIGLKYSKDRRIYIRDQLTKFKAKLFRDTLALKNVFGLKYIWISNYNICVRKDDLAKTYVIRSSVDISTLKRQFEVTVNTVDES